jgi:hypothetical protein
MFFYMTDVAIFNSYALQKKITGKKQHFTEFRIQLAEFMIESVVPSTWEATAGPFPCLSSGSSLGSLCSVHSPQSQKEESCVVCKLKKKKSETRYECSKCFGGATCSRLF